MTYYQIYAFPVGKILVAEQDGNITHLTLEGCIDTSRMSRGDTPLLDRTADALRGYFAGERDAFGGLPLSPQGTPFQREVWQALCAIPYGQTISYAQLAMAVGRPKAARAVGAANGKNPIFIIIPCHRVIGANGSLTGFAYGIELKRSLLEIESMGNR